MTKNCVKVFTHRFERSTVTVGAMATEYRGRVVVCLGERGVEPQHFFIARAGLLALAEVLVAAFRQLHALRM